jgi:hypothetical protein
MNKKLLAVVFVSVAVLCLAGPPAAQAKGGEFKGILADVACWTAGTAGDGTDMKANPEKHTVACLKMPGCEASGYGVIMKNAEGQNEFLKFDAAGNKMAIDLLKKTKKTDNMTVKVMGVKEQDMLKVESIVETE